MKRAAFYVKLIYKLHNFKKRCDRPCIETASGPSWGDWRSVWENTFLACAKKVCVAYHSPQHHPHDRRELQPMISLTPSHHIVFLFLSWPSLLGFLHALLRVLPVFPICFCISTFTGDKQGIYVSKMIVFLGREVYMSSQPGPRRFYGTGGVIFSRWIFILDFLQILSRLCQQLTRAMM